MKKERKGQLPPRSFFSFRYFSQQLLRKNFCSVQAQKEDGRSRPSSFDFLFV